MNIKEIYEDYMKTKSLRKTAEKYKLNRAVLTKTFRLNNYPILENIKLKNKALITEDIFNILTKESAYWLGFIYADGYIDEKRNTLRIELSSKDLEHLQQFAKFINYNKELKFRTERDTYYLAVSNKNLITNLKKYGLTQKKSLTCTFPKLDEYNKEFINGYFDGDGSVYYVGKNGSGLNIVGTLSFLEDINKELQNIGKIRKVKNTEIYRFELTSNNKVLEFYKTYLLSKDVCLKRKLSKFEFIQARSSTTKLPLS